MNFKRLEKDILTRKTKLVTTIGPASEKGDIFPNLFKNGSTCVRMNFSHGDHQEHQNRIDATNKIIREQKVGISLLLDTKGPEIRTGNFDGGSVAINKGDIIQVHCNKPFLGNNKKIYIDYKNLAKDLANGGTIYLDDGKLRLAVIKSNPEISRIEVKALNSHSIKNRRGVNLPGTPLSLKFLSDKDKKDLIFGCEQKVHYVAASFVRNGKDVQTIRKFLNKHGGENIKIIPKIECQEAVEKFDEILKKSDGIMLARGDLGMEIYFELVPRIEKECVRKCIIQRKPIIIATQMLDSMQSNPTPTRAEVTDVFWAIDLGASATMLSGESANGDYPLESTETSAIIARQAESEISYNFQSKIAIKKWPKVIRPLAKAALAQEFNALVAFEPEYDQIAQIASMHLPLNIIVITKDLFKLSQFGFHYGVKTIYSDLKPSADKNKLIELVEKSSFIESENFNFKILNKDYSLV